MLRAVPIAIAGHNNLDPRQSISGPVLDDGHVEQPSAPARHRVGRAEPRRPEGLVAPHQGRPFGAEANTALMSARKEARVVASALTQVSSRVAR